MKNILLLFICILTITSCQVGGSTFQNSSQTIKGNSYIVSQEYSIGDYSRIKVENQADIIYEQKPLSRPYLIVETDENLLPYISVSVKDGVLILRSTENLKTKHCKVYTNSRSLAGVQVSGVSNIELRNPLDSKNLVINFSGVGGIKAYDLKCDNLNANLSGVANFTFGGTVRNSVLNVSGKGDIYAYELNAANTDCNVSGIGKIETYTTDYLKAKMSGVGNVRYKGAPKHTEISKSGVGSIKPY